MNKVGANKHLVSEVSSADIYRECLNNPPAPEVQEKIENLQEVSNNFINHALALSPVPS